MFTFWSIFFNNTKNQTTGGVRDIPDERYLRFQEIIAGAALPEQLPVNYLLEYKFPVKNQYQRWSCVGEAWAAQKAYQEGVELSGLDLYRWCKENDNYPPKGTYTRMGGKALTDYGAVEQPFVNDSWFTTEESCAAYRRQLNALDNAPKHKSLRLVNCGPFDVVVSPDTFTTKMHELVKKAIYSNHLPVVMAIPWYPEYNRPPKDGLLPLPKPMADNVGHVVTVLGWDTDNNLICLNSFGPNWGVNGRFLLSPQAPKWDAWLTIDLPAIPAPPIAPVTRDKGLEQKKALELRTYLYLHFAPNDKARGWAGVNWFACVNAVTYLGYTYTDITNVAFAASRGQIMPFDISKQK